MTRVLEWFDEEEGAPSYLVSGLGRTASSAATTRYFSHSMSGSSAIFCFPGRSRCSPACSRFAYYTLFHMLYDMHFLQCMSVFHLLE